MTPARTVLLSVLILCFFLVSSFFRPSSPTNEPKPAKAHPIQANPLARNTQKKQTPATKKSLASQTRTTGNPASPAVSSERGQFGLAAGGQRPDPLVNIPEDAVARAMAQRERMEQGQIRLLGEETLPVPQPGPAWSALGPGSVMASDGSASGRVTAIATDPRNPDTVYIGASGGGVWKSTDAGKAWTSLGDHLMTLVSGALAFDDRSGTLYYGTGDYGARTYGAGVFRSSDGGATWLNSSGWNTTLNKAQFTGGTTYRLALDPSNPQTIFAARNTGLWRSTDGGDTWYRLIAGEASDFAIDPLNPNRMYVALGYYLGANENGVFRSDDGGANWRFLPGIPSGVIVGRISLGLSPSNPAVLYVVLTRSADQQMMATYRSNDYGGTWTQIAAPFSAFDSDGRGHGYFDNFVAVDPADPNAVYLGGVELFKSADGGNTWSMLSLSGGTRVIHEDQFAIAFRPGTPNVVYVGNDGGIYRSDDGGKNWLSLNAELPITQFNSVATNANDPPLLLGGTQDQGLVRYSGDRTWVRLIRGDAGAVLYGADASTIYVAKQLINPLRSINGGTSFVSLSGGISASDRVAFYPPLASSPANPQTLYFGTHRVWRSPDGGNSWSAISGDLTGGPQTGGYLTAVAVASTGAVFAGSSDGSISFSSAGDAWTSGTGIPNRAVTSIATDPQNPAVAYLTVALFGTGHVFKTQDGGATWTDASGNLPDAPANSIVVDPAGPLYVATDIGVFRSEDGGVYWTSFNLGLPNVFVKALALDAKAGKLLAATYGRGIYQSDVKPPRSAGPALSWGSVVNGFSYAPVLAPGMIASVFGMRLTAGETASADAALPTTMAGTSITVNGVLAPMFYASPGQVNFQVPFEVTGSTAIVVVTTAEGSTALLVPLMPASPGLVGVVLHSADYAPVTDDNPAAQGELLVVFATGLGATNPAVATGAPSPLDPLAVATVNVACGFGGQPGTVWFAGLAPGYTGLYQINVQVPTGVSGQVPLTLTAAGRAANTLTIAVR